LNKTQLLATLYEMRTNAQYQTAETLRRKSSVADMAKADRNSLEFGAINLLINTWETISILVLEIKDKDSIFEILPVLYMFTELSDAIDIISCKFPAYAANFRLLSKQQLEWLKFKDERYQTGEKSGMHALFG
jgi:hypothetical protein